MNSSKLNKMAITTLFNLIFVTFLLMVMASPVRALRLTVDPDQFALGTNISNSFPGVKLLAVGSLDTAVYATSSPLATTGTNVFGWRPPYGIIPTFQETGGGGTSMIAEFDYPTNFVSIDYMAPTDEKMEPFVFGRDTNNNWIADTKGGPLGIGESETIILTSPTANIAKVIFTVAGNDSYQLDNLNFNAIPEPATMFLLGSGLFGLAVVGRKKFRK